MDVREKLVELLQDGNNPVWGWFPNNMAMMQLAEYLISNGVTVQDNTEISDELLERLRKAPVTVITEEPTVEVVHDWISVDERLPENFISVLGYMTDSGEFPPVRECYTVGNAFFFPALGDVHPVSHWLEMPQPPKGE